MLLKRQQAVSKCQGFDFVVGREASEQRSGEQKYGAGEGCLAYKEHSGPELDSLLSFLLRPEQ